MKSSIVLLAILLSSLLRADEVKLSDYEIYFSSDSPPELFIFPLEAILRLVPKMGKAPIQQCEVFDKENETENGPTPLPSGFNSRCTNFIKKDGTNGTWGTYVKDYVEANKDVFFSSTMPGMITDPKTCPNWGSFDDEKKSQFWVWMMASIAQVESSCKSDAVNTGAVPDATDRPRGLLQLNTLKKNRSWRGKNCKFPSDVDSVTNPKNNLLCGLDIMKEILLGKKGVYKTNGKIFPTNSYWEKLRPNHSKTGGPIGKLVRQFTPCGASK